MPELTEEQFSEVKGVYEELKAIESSLPIDDYAYIEGQIILCYHNLIQRLEKIVGGLSQFMVSPSQVDEEKQESTYLTIPLRIKLRLLMAYILTKYNIEGDKVVGIGNIIKIIQDEELKNRCIDLLSAEGQFDRVIREATTILENRIRNIADPKLREVGVNLVNKALNHEKGILVLDGESYEQEGYYQLYRGVMLSFRDGTHHRIVERFTREDAFKTLAFIDILLETLKRSKRRQNT